MDELPDSLPSRAEIRETRDIFRAALDMPLASMAELTRNLEPSKDGWAVHKVGFPLCERPPEPDLVDIDDIVLVDELAVLWAGPAPGHWRGFVIGKQGRRTVCAPIVQRLVAELLERGWSYRRIGQMVGAGHTTVRSWHTRTARAKHQVATYTVGGAPNLGGERRRRRIATHAARDGQRDPRDIAVSVLRFLGREYPGIKTPVLRSALATAAEALAYRDCHV